MFSIDHRMVNAISQYLQYAISVIDETLTNIIDNMKISILNFTTGFFQIAIKLDDIVKKRL